MGSEKNSLQKAFTIIESLIVLLILAILSVVITALFRHVEDDETKSLVPEIANDTVLPLDSDGETTAGSEESDTPIKPTFRLQSSKKPSQ